MYNDLRRKNEKIPYLSFIVELAEGLIVEGIKNSSLRTPRRGATSKKRKLFAKTPLHLPVEGETRRRCARRARENKQTRTKTICVECSIPLCKQ